MRYISIFSLLISAASLASASTLSTTCTQNVYMTQSGSGQNVVCGGFTAPIGSAITDIKWGLVDTIYFDNFILADTLEDVVTVRQ